MGWRCTHTKYIYGFALSYGFQRLSCANSHKEYAFTLSYRAGGCGLRELQSWVRSIVFSLFKFYREWPAHRGLTASTKIYKGSVLITYGSILLFSPHLSGSELQLDYSCLQFIPLASPCTCGSNLLVWLQLTLVAPSSRLMAPTYPYGSTVYPWLQLVPTAPTYSCGSNLYLRLQLTHVAPSSRLMAPTYVYGSKCYMRLQHIPVAPTCTCGSNLCMSVLLHNSLLRAPTYTYVSKAYGSNLYMWLL